jgi:hypothetical protein
MILLFFVFLIVLTVNAVYDILKNEMNEGDNILDFFEYFGFEYPGLEIVWIVIAVVIFVVSLIVWACGIGG